MSATGAVSGAPVYLDHNATTAPAPEVVAAMVDALQGHWANPSSVHEPGQDARRLLAASRATVAGFLGCQPAELVFTSGATEANHLAVTGALALARAAGRRRWLLSAVEHPALLALADRLAGEGVDVKRLPVDRAGRVDAAAALAAITADVALVSVMGANNETGVVMPIAALAERARAVGALFHTDATQLAGKWPLRFGATGADLMSVSAHKLHGPKGVGALVVRKGLALPPVLAGRQERGRRGGTENVSGIAGFAAACARAQRTLDDDLARMSAMRDRLQRALAPLAGVHVYGAAAERVPNTLCLRIGALDAERVLSRLERAGVVASSGAACTAAGTEPSHVLIAMGESPLHARAAVRLSLGRGTTEADVDRTIAGMLEHVVPLLLESRPVAARAAG